MKIKTYSTNPELCVVGAKCHVSLPSNWIGAYDAVKRGEYIVWLPAKIVEVSWGKNECFKTDPGIPAVTVYVRASQKYHTQNVERLQCLPSQVEDCIRFR